MPPASIETTPAVTPDSTASVNCRRASSWVLAVTSAVCCAFSCPVMRLKARASVPISSGEPLTGHARIEVARPDPVRGIGQSRDRAAQPLASHSANHTAADRISSDDDDQQGVEAQLEPRLRASKLLVLGERAAWFR